MLSARFINPQVLTVLPFYLQTSFKEVEAIPHIRIFLPPPSGIENLKACGPTSSSSSSSHSALTQANNNNGGGSSSNSGSSSGGGGGGSGGLVAMGMSGSFRIIEMSNHIAKNVESNVSNLQDQTRSRFALRRILETVRGCKEEMWKEYEKINRSERKTVNPRADREDFEIHFYNWEWWVRSLSFFFSPFFLCGWEFELIGNYHFTLLHIIKKKKFPRRRTTVTCKTE